MAFGFLNLPKSKWWDALRQVILKNDFKDIETALLEAPGLTQTPNIVLVDATSVKVPATADCPAAVLMSGFPNILHPGAFVTGGLADGKYRDNIADTTMDFDVSASLWGTEKVSQWYVIFALAANADAVFTLKAMPYMRVKSQAGQVISLGTLVAPGTGIGYGLTTDELIGGMVYVLNGASRGLMRPITANNNDNSTGGTITYSGSALTLAQGDVFIVLPPATNFRYLGAIYNNPSSDIICVYSGSGPQTIRFETAGTHPFIVPPGVFFVKEATVIGGGGGGGAGGNDGGGGAAVEVYNNYPVTPGASITVVVGAGGSFASNGGASGFDTLPPAHGGWGGSGGNPGDGGAANITASKYRVNQAAGFTNVNGGNTGLNLAGNGIIPGGGGASNGDGGGGAVYVSC